MRRRVFRWLARGVAVILVTLAGFFLWRWTGGNFGTIQKGRIYRAGQPSAGSLRKTIETHHIKTVLNLRGENPSQPWYRGERATTLDAGSVQVDFPMASDQWLSREQARILIEILDRSEYPLLIHCEWGAERTGLVSAITQLLCEGSSLAEARAQFSLYYLFLPAKDGLIMRGHLDLYERWLAAKGQPHSPTRFRQWIGGDYEPKNPSRQYWPCDLYPLRVVSRNGSREATWSESRCR